MCLTSRPRRLALAALPSALLLMLGAALPVALAQNSTLDRATETLLRDEQLAHAALGIAVVDLASGEAIKSVNAGRSLVPASLMKVPTTATALAVLGADFRFETELCYAGAIDGEGTLRGDLLIVGGGDPSLGAGRPGNTLDLDGVLDRWARAVADAGIRRVEGSVVGEHSLDPGNEPSPYWQWNDIGNYYGAGAGALNVHENYYTLRLQRTAREGGRPQIVGYGPDPGELRWTNEVASGPAGSGDQSYIFGAPGTRDRVIRGTIPAGKGVFKVKGSLPDPPERAAAWLTERLRERGIAVSGTPAATTEPRGAGAAQLDVLRSASLGELVRLTNYRSVNLFAEAIYEATARALGADPTDQRAVGEAFADYWQRRGVAPAGYEQVDGSGLGMRNLITARQLAQVLRLSAGDLRQNLPRVGAEGTVRSVMRGQSRAARIRAKSGTMKRSRGFCGYATLTDGREVCFVVMANNFSGSGRALRRKLGDWMGALVE